jgi:hypothetical protein
VVSRRAALATSHHEPGKERERERERGTDRGERRGERLSFFTLSTAATTKEAEPLDSGAGIYTRGVRLAVAVCLYGAGRKDGRAPGRLVGPGR